MRLDCRLTILAFINIIPLTLYGYFHILQPYKVSPNSTDAALLSNKNTATAPSSSPFNSSTSHTTTARIKDNNVSSPSSPSIISQTELEKPNLKYYIIAPPEYTDDLLLKNDSVAHSYYPFALNEESAEIWLHRAFQNSTFDDGHTLDASQADVFLIAGYLHLNQATPNRHHNLTIMIQQYKDLIINKTKPHLLLTPTWNPGKSRLVGAGPLADALLKDGVNMWSVGIERNKSWQGLLPSRIIPIPYVVNQSIDLRNDQSSLTSKTENSVFYTGDARRHAQQWGGCFREKMILPLQENSTLPNIDVRIVGKMNRMPQREYNHRMITSEFCLILCGDTPTSRSLTSAMVSGCIPILVGSRLRGLCEPPCQAKFGWSVSGEEYPHLAFANRIPWNKFPEVNEAEFTRDGDQVLRQVFSKYDKAKKEELRTIMNDVREGWIYGWGDPVNSTSFGQVHKYLWEEFQQLVA